MREQIRKHVSQMTIADKHYLLDQFAENWSHHPKLHKSQHLIDEYKKGNRFFNFKIAEHTIRHFYECIVEYNEVFVNGYMQSRRVLLRSTQVTKHKGKYVNMCFVIDIDTLTVVTSFPCAVNDNHKTLRKELYTETLNIIKD